MVERAPSRTHPLFSRIATPRPPKKHNSDHLPTILTIIPHINCGVLVVLLHCRPPCLRALPLLKGHPGMKLKQLGNLMGPKQTPSIINIWKSDVDSRGFRMTEDQVEEAPSFGGVCGNVEGLRIDKCLPD